MNYYQARIQYDGTNYFGFQWQKDIPTIQNDFNLVLKKIIPEKVTTMGASRTDTGVHALDQIIKITTEFPIECGTFLTTLNQNLPAQIKCLDIIPCDGAFKPTITAVSKEYRYFFTNQKIVSLPELRFIANHSKKLDLNSMMICVKEILGTHDFKNYCSTGSNVKSTVRTITICELGEVNPHTTLPNLNLFSLPPNLTSCYQLKIVGNGFLKQMIRHLVGALWMVGSGKLNPDDFLNLLHGAKIDQRKWKVAPPNGLFLYQINF